MKVIFICVYFFFNFIYFIFRQTGKGREREREKHQCMVVSFVAPTGDVPHNSGICPDCELNQWPCGL